jgi:hypothetical protein
MNLKQHADFFQKDTGQRSKKSLLPEQITCNGTVITVPAGWLPKPKPEDGKAVLSELPRYPETTGISVAYNRLILL